MWVWFSVKLHHQYPTPNCSRLGVFFCGFRPYAGLQPLYINHLCACRYETRNATLDLRRIHPRAYRGWGDIVAGRAPVDPYAMITFAATHPQKVRLRQYNSASF